MKFTAKVLLMGLFISGSLQAMDPELIIIHANVRTMDKAKPTAEAVAVLGNKIVAVGNNAEIEKLRGPKTRVIDAKGKLVLPGFNDSHVHFLMGGFSLSNVDLRDAKSPEEMAKRLADYAKTIPKGQWIT